MHNREERLFYIDLASEQPDMTKEQELVFYKENAIHNKEELLGTIQEAKEVLCAKERDAKRRSEVCISRLEKLFDRFYADVQTMFLMELSDWWGYGISVRETGISLKLCHFAVLYDFNRDATDEYPTRGELAADEDYTLHCTSSKLLSLEEFGMIHDVAADTDKNALGHIAQLGSRPGGAVCQGDRLGAAGGHLQLALENFTVAIVNWIMAKHVFHLLNGYI